VQGEVGEKQREVKVAEFLGSNLASAPMDHSAAPWAGQNSNNRMELDEPRNDDEGDNNISSDSSEEEEDDPEEARKIQEGFIVDEDEEEEEEEEEEEGSGDEVQSKERHRGSPKKRRRRKGLRLPSFSYLIADSDLLQKDAQRKKKEAKPASLTRKIWNL
jgi:hypothetical protein